jgi:hypothetical protein
LTSGPPESPGWIGASVWISPVSCSLAPDSSSEAVIDWFSAARNRPRPASTTGRLANRNATIWVMSRPTRWRAHGHPAQSGGLTEPFRVANPAIILTPAACLSMIPIQAPSAHRCSSFIGRHRASRPAW